MPGRPDCWLKYVGLFAEGLCQVSLNHLHSVMEILIKSRHTGRFSTGSPLLLPAEIAQAW